VGECLSYIFLNALLSPLLQALISDISSGDSIVLIAVDANKMYAGLERLPKN